MQHFRRKLENTINEEFQIAEQRRESYQRRKEFEVGIEIITIQWYKQIGLSSLTSIQMLCSYRRKERANEANMNRNRLSLDLVKCIRKSVLPV